MDTTNHGSKIPTKPTEGKNRKMSEKHMNMRGIKMKGRLRKQHNFVHAIFSEHF